MITGEPQSSTSNPALANPGGSETAPSSTSTEDGSHLVAIILPIALALGFLAIGAYVFYRYRMRNRRLRMHFSNKGESRREII